MTTLKKRGGRRSRGFAPLQFGKGSQLKSRDQSNSTPTGKAERPAFLGLPMAACVVERTECGDYAAFTTDDMGGRQAIGCYADAVAALDAARSAFAGAGQ
jgi:hypothetical protein